MQEAIAKQLDQLCHSLEGHRKRMDAYATQLKAWQVRLCSSVRLQVQKAALHPICNKPYRPAQS